MPCPGKQIKAPDSAYENAFYPPTVFGYNAIRRIEYEARHRGIHIHHQLCGHGGERLVAGTYVDGYHPENKTVFQCHGCHFHGCSWCCRGDLQNEVLYIDRKGKPITRAHARSQTLRNCGYTVVGRWEREDDPEYSYEPCPWRKDRVPTKKNETYPHAVVYDFEAYQDKTKAFQPTQDWRHGSEHVSVSVSIADTLNREPENICFKNPAELIQKFYEALKRRSAAILADVCAKYMPPDLEGVTNNGQELIKQWCEQMPVIGFNSGHYDLYLIRKYFVFHLGQETGVFAGEKNGRIMFINAPPLQVPGRDELCLSGHKLRQVGQDLWRDSDQILAAL